MEAEFVVNDLIGRTMADLQRAGCLIDGKSLVRQYNLTNLLHPLVAGGG
jgi:hypothetical protein